MKVRFNTAYNSSSYFGSVKEDQQNYAITLLVKIHFNPTVKLPAPNGSFVDLITHKGLNL